MPIMASSRIQRYLSYMYKLLSGYIYQMAGKDQGNAAGLSRLPIAEAPEEASTPGDTILMLHATCFL